MTTRNDFLESATDLQCTGHVIGHAVLQEAEHIKKRRFSAPVSSHNDAERRQILNGDILKNLEVFQVDFSIFM